jgi:hypothetical protein
MLHHGWRHVDAVLIDSRVKRMIRLTDDGPLHPEHEYIIEFTGESGQRVRLTVMEKVGHVRVPAHNGVVPVLVHPGDTKAVIDEHDPRVNLAGLLKVEEKTSEMRFQAELNWQEE